MNISKKSKPWIAGTILPLILLVVWQSIAYSGYIPVLILPSPEAVVKTFITQFTEKDLLFHIFASFRRVLSGFLIGTAGGFSFGLLIGLSRSAEKIFSPFFNIIRQVSIIGWIPLIVPDSPVYVCRCEKCTKSVYRTLLCLWLYRIKSDTKNCFAGSFAINNYRSYFGPRYVMGNFNGG